jgi:patatin-like phospholipase/acyl hydrolase
VSAFRIHSLDGGGIMGAFSASVLATYESDCQRVHHKRLVDHFDLITGTSTGGIIAVGLVMGVPAEAILRFYQDHGFKIFPRTGGVGAWLKRVGSLFGPKFRAGVLRDTLSRVVGTKTLRDAVTRLVVPTYDAAAGEVYLFKTPHHPDCTQNADVPAVDVALATSAAPTYFPAHEVPGRGTYIDGGVWGNCPAVVGIIEAVSFCQQRLEDIHLLSISTTSYPFRIARPQQVGGLIGWAPKIVDTLMCAQVQGAVGSATCLLRDRAMDRRADRFHRIDYVAEPKVYALDNAAAVSELVHLGRTRAEAVPNRTVVMERFLNGVAAGQASTG